MAYFAVCTSCNDLTFILTVTDSLEHGSGKYDCAPSHCPTKVKNKINVYLARKSTHFFSISHTRCKTYVLPCRSRTWHFHLDYSRKKHRKFVIYFSGGPIALLVIYWHIQLTAQWWVSSQVLGWTFLKVTMKRRSVFAGRAMNLIIPLPTYLIELSKMKNKLTSQSCFS